MTGPNAPDLFQPAPARPADAQPSAEDSAAQLDEDDSEDEDWYAAADRLSQWPRDRGVAVGAVDEPAAMPPVTNR